MREHLFGLDEAESDLLKSAAYLAESIGSSDGHAEAMKEIVAHFAALGEVDHAAHLADTVDDPFVRDRLLLQVAEKCAEIDDDEYALQLVEAIEETGFQSAAVEKLAMRKAAVGEFDKAFKLAESIEHSSDAFAAIAVEQSARGLSEESEKTLARIEFYYARVNALLAIAGRFESGGEKEKAREAVNRAVEAAKFIEFREERIRALLDAATHFLEIGANDRAIETLSEARGDIESSNVGGSQREGFLSQIALGFLRAGSLDLAERTLDLIADKVAVATTLVGYSTQFDEKGERGEALETLEEAYQILQSQPEKEVRNSTEKFNLYAAVAALFARYEKTERALEIASDIRAESARHSALNQIAQICAARGQDDLAHQAVNLIDDESARLFALIALSDVKRRHEKREEAVQYLAEARAFGAGVPQFSSRSLAYNQLAERFHLLGETGKAREIASESLETVAQIRDLSSKAVGLLNVSDVFKSLGFELSAAERDVLRTMLRKAQW
jgi:tetratricopeptide (TPR) repeat protein